MTRAVIQSFSKWQIFCLLNVLGTSFFTLFFILPVLRIANLSANHNYTSFFTLSFNLPVFRMANLSADSGGMDEMGRVNSQDNSLQSVARRATNLSLPGLGAANTRSLFIFSEENFIRKYAKTIIEWGYPFCIHLWVTSNVVP